MPIYEYKCGKCGKISEFLMETGENASAMRCNFCGSIEIKKIFSAVHVSAGTSVSESQNGRTCCGRTERCDIPPCSGDGICKR